MSTAPDARADDYHHGDLRNALIQAAIEVLQASPAGELSLRDLARRVGVSRTAPYRHFADKDAVLAAVAEQGFHLLREAILEARDRAAPEPGPDSLARLEAGCLAYLGFAAGHPAHYRVMFGAMKDREDHAALACAGQAAFQELVDGLAECQAHGHLRPGDARADALVVWSALHGVADIVLSELVVPDVEVAPEDLGRLVLGTVLAGLRGAAGA